MIFKPRHKLEYVEEESVEESMLSTSNLLTSKIQLEGMPRPQASNRHLHVVANDDSLSKLGAKVLHKNRSLTEVLAKEPTIPAGGR